ncbi:MAG: enoyl-CoA hydratase-related protein, partial [Janthinobacterium lividum]
HTAQPDLIWRAERDVWSHALTDPAAARLFAAAGVATEAEMLALPAQAFVAAIWSLAPVTPLDAEFPMFFIYTSGSTGKPKGVVHVHGGYTAGIAETMKVAFDARPGDVIYVVADPGWITGQSYLISASLTSRVTTVICEGAPVFPHAGRFAASIERHKVTIFKAGVTFLKFVMSDAQNLNDIRAYDMGSLRVATFCAEPTSPAVQAFGMANVTPRYINSYWATEHGGIAWTHFYGNADFPLRADAHTYPLPWIVGDVWVEGDAGEEAEGIVFPRTTPGGTPHRPAEAGEKGEVVIAAPYPYLARTVWSSDGFSVTDGQVAPGWRGDADRWENGYWTRWAGAWAYTQGDFAMRHADGSFSLHGRSDDVINVSGHRMGTEEIEGAILRDKALDPDSPVGNVLVVGAPHREKGLTPIAFVVPSPGRKITQDDRRRLTDLVRTEKGAVAVPQDFLEVAEFPETRSGKYVRRMVRALVEGTDVGDTSTLKNPGSLVALKATIDAWQRKQKLSEDQQLFERYRYFRIQYNAVAPGRKVATVFVTNPPVNALNERALDELNIVVEHLSRRDDVVAVIFTGDGTASFVAGADIRQFLDEIHTVEEARVLPNNAQLAFNKIDAMTKPCIAAIQGVALGGGMEFALACHYRIAEPTARFGQPEIRLRLIPGYGGTQRLPRLLGDRRGSEGLRDSLDLILGGRSIDAEAALAMGAIDEVVEGSDSALSRAHALVREFVQAVASNLQQDSPSTMQEHGPPPPKTGEDLESSKPHRPLNPPPPSGEGDRAAWRGGGGLAQAHAARLNARAAWAKPSNLDLDTALADPFVQRIVRQLDWAGRGAARDAAIDAIRTGLTHGIAAGLAAERDAFATAVVDPKGGKTGIREFLDKKSPPLPIRRDGMFVDGEHMGRGSALEAMNQLLPVGAPFFPGVQAIPSHQYAFGIARDADTGAPRFGQPASHERELIVPVDAPAPNDALVYMLTSEVNFNDIWALTGIPVSPFDGHEKDYQTTGSGGVGLVAALGSEARAEGRLKVGDLVAVYSGTNDLLSPQVGRDPMFADFAIQGYETPTGSHAQFLTVQAPQLHPVPGDLTLAQAGSYILNLGTVYRALFTTLDIAPGKTLFVEGAATGTGHDAMKTAVKSGLAVTGLVSSEARADYVRTAGATAALNRTDPRFAALYTMVPEEDPAAWEAAGQPLVDEYRALNEGKLADYVVSHAGETAFPRSFQLLAEGGVLAFYGASSGYHFSFVGKPGSIAPE